MAKGNSKSRSGNQGKVREALRNPTIVLDNLKQNTKIENYKYKRLYRNLYNQNFFLLAYNKIYSNPGNMTKGADGATIDNFTINRIEAIITKLKSKTYIPNPALRTYIEKKNGKLRPLGIQSVDDKLVQEIIREILENIWEDLFLDCSHGFRPNRSCHTALAYVDRNFNGVRWFVEGDIEGFFNNIDHHILIKLLRRRIQDEHFLGLIWKFLKAGYLEDWKFNSTYSGTAQGSIISTILANIYLHELDKYMMEYKILFDKGAMRKRNPIYRKIESKKYRISKKLKTEIALMTSSEILETKQSLRSLEKILVTTPNSDPFDKDYKRLFYTRYADDFIVGIIGSKADALKVKEDIKKYINKQLLLNLSDEKTLITHSKKKIRFLGYDLLVKRNNTPIRDKSGTLRRVHNLQLKLYVTKEVWLKKLIEYEVMHIKQIQNKEIWYPNSRNAIQNNKDINILKQFNSEVRGLYNYYKMACNVSFALHRFNYFMYYSMLKTLSRKYKRSLKQIRIQYDINGKFGIQHNESSKLGALFYYNKGFKTQKNIPTPNNPQYNDLKPKYRFPFGKYSPAYRLRNKSCELCGARNVSVIMHHVRKLTELKANSPWNIKMLENNRKTLASCESCYSLIQLQS